MTKKESANIETIDPANQNRDTKSWTNNIKLPPKYLPKQKEEYMCDKQLKYFYEKLLTWKNELIQESNVTVEHLKEKNMQEPDNADRATLKLYENGYHELQNDLCKNEMLTDVVNWISSQL